ncbi:MAG: excinuclease ABC subunit UvrA [Planctomycetota bacterium]
MRRRTKTSEVSPTHGSTDGNVNWLTVVAAAHNNLKDIDVHIPLGRFVCVTGVSGSGKSSLVDDILREQLARDLNGAEKVNPGRHQRIDGLEHLDKVIDIDQSPIGRTPRSNPVTYIKVFDEIRALFAKLPDSKVRGYRPGRFSFNVPSGAKGGGRCEACEGNGANKMEMDFLADVWVTCPVCNSRRFNRETLQILFKGKSIADVLEMDVQEAVAHFTNIPKIAAMLQTLHDVGLDYIKLGQSSTTLSGGEAQRIKLARELVKKSTGRTLYLLDEPTTGLHFDDIKKLLAVLHGFVDAGNSVAVIEHNLDVVKTADWIIDLGPEGGEGGGSIVAEGTPEEVAQMATSYTGQVLRKVLGPRAPVRADLPDRSGRRPRRPSACEDAGRYRRTRTGEPSAITVVGARQHNLKNITVRVPRGKTTVCTGLSGSGKSSFAIDTVYAEGQRRYVESLSAYARQFLGRLQKPKVEHVEGLSPAICIEQKSAGHSPRSTVGTVTEIYDYMRVLWARIGKPYCPKCAVPIGTQTSDEIIERVLALEEGTPALLLAPLEHATHETYAELFARERANGFTRVRVDGVLRRLDEDLPVDPRRRHEIELVVDRIVVKRAQAARLADSVEQTLTLGNGVMKVAVLEEEARGKRQEAKGKRQEGRGEREEGGTSATPFNRQSSIVNRQSEYRFSQLHSCTRCGKSYDELTPHHFSFNSAMGWCRSCEGLGTQLGASAAAIVVHPTRSLMAGALAGWRNLDPHHPLGRCVQAVADRIGFNPERPWHELPEPQRLAFLQGGDEEWIAPDFAGIENEPAWCGVRIRWKGFYSTIDRATRANWQYRKRLEELVTAVPCEACGGSRLRPEARNVRLGGKTVPEVCALPLDRACAFFTKLNLDARERKIAGELLHEITARLRFLIDVGLSYVTLNRAAPTLSGGEAQRIRLASQIGSGLTGVLYVLDEPTIGLHPRDNGRLIAALGKLRDLGNTVLMVEHDREVIAHADHVLDFGPGAGQSGGRIVAAASPAQLPKRKASLTGRYLAGKEAIIVPRNRRPVMPDTGDRRPEKWLTVHGAYENNLKEIDVEVPLGRFTAVSGVSGSGKSSLVTEILYKALAARIHRARLVPGGHARISGIEHVDKVINVDQAPIGSSPTSNPATYTGVFDLLRELFARLPESKVRGYGPNRFSFNRPGGRCEACEGNGQRCIEMHFLPDVWVECEACGGTRYNRETLEVRYKGKSIADVLEMPVAEALEHFRAIPKLCRMLRTLDDVGLGYVRLGQPGPTLSGGEVQRVKLAAELGRPSTGKTLYILDEPTTGLHFEDLKKLLNVLQRLVDLGNTVVCIEHHLDVLKSADWVIDLGPEAGDEGGSIVAAGTPETVANTEGSHTGAALKPVLEGGPYVERPVYDPAAYALAETEWHRPLRLDNDQASAKLPWQVDGRRWHTVNHVDRNGKPAQWDPQLLIWWVETIEQLGPFAPTDWNDRARVEIKAPGSKTQWFMHALTGGRWQLELTLRVPSGTFSEAKLIDQLAVKTLDERTDLPIYGQWSRVFIRKSDRGFENVRLYLHDFKDVNKAAFRSFLKQAVAAYFRMVKATQADPETAEPWKTNGRQWHLSQRGITKRYDILWKPTALVEWLGRLNKLVPDVETIWTGKVAIKLGLRGADKPFGYIVTNQRWGLRVELMVPKSAFTFVQIERLGKEPKILPRPDHDVVQFWVQRLTDNDPSQLAAVLHAAVRSRKPEDEQ